MPKVPPSFKMRYSAGISAAVWYWIEENWWSHIEVLTCLTVGIAGILMGVERWAKAGKAMRLGIILWWIVMGGLILEGLLVLWMYPPGTM
jgi:hypothetical protein